MKKIRRRGLSALINGFPTAKAIIGIQDALTIRDAIGETVRRARVDSKLTQTALAKKAGIARTTLVNIEMAHQSPTWEGFFGIASALDIPPWLLVQRACQMMIPAKGLS